MDAAKGERLYRIASAEKSAGKLSGLSLGAVLGGRPDAFYNRQYISKVISSERSSKKDVSMKIFV